MLVTECICIRFRAVSSLSIIVAVGSYINKDASSPNGKVDFSKDFSE